MQTSKQATVTIDLDAVAHNFQLVKELAPSSKIMAVVKADAYGHGATEVAKKLKDANAFAVSRVSEGARLRESGVAGNICVLAGAGNKEELNLASVYELQLVVHAEEQADLLNSASARRSVWAKIDTGMGRLGIRPERAEALLRKMPNQKLLGLMTHFPNADLLGDKQALEQTKELIALSRSLKTDFPAAGTLSLANSAAVMHLPDTHEDWVRPGIMLFGANPMVDQGADLQLEPAMLFSAPIVAVKKLRNGESVGYGSTWTASADCQIAVVAAGYADGYPRETGAGTPVLVNGLRRQIVGRVSMDLLTILLEDGDAVEMGDHVTLWGGGLPIEEISACAGTVPYTLMSGIADRVKKVHRGG